ncbi:MAG: NrsF family protein [Myxococcota bacterium]
MSDSAERLIDNLVDDLEPVTPLPRLRSAYAVILCVWATMLGVVLWSQESTIGARSLMHNGVYLCSFLGLMVAAFGATISALASGIPGRDRLETVGTALSVLGLGFAALACGMGIHSLGLDARPTPAGIDLMCFEESVWLSVLPAGVILTFLVRGWAAHPFRASAIALIASGGLGALIVHLSCGFLGPKHLLISHLSVPVVLAVLGIYPLALLIRRIRR